MPASSDPLATLSQLAYEQATAALARQQEVLEGLRTRGGQVFTAAAISLPLFGGPVASGRPFGLLGWFGVMAFLIVGAMWLVMLWPRMSLERSVRLLRITQRDQLIAGFPTADVAQIALAEHLEAAYRRNEPRVARIAACLRTETIFLIVALVCWVADLAIRA